MDIKEIKIMIEEQYVSIATAKLAKEKGFTGIMCNRCYGNDCQYYSFNVDNIGDEDLGIAAPTQSLLARWLREKCGKNIYVVMGTSERYIVWIQDIHSLVKVKITNFFDTYEYAMEEGLQQALKLIN